MPEASANDPPAVVSDSLTDAPSWRPGPWPVVAGGSGALLLVQTSFGALLELVAGEPRFGHVLSCIIAAAILVGGILARNAPTLLLAFPVALLAPIVTLSPEAATALGSPGPWLCWIGTLVLYLAATSAWLARPTVPALPLRREPTPQAPPERRRVAFFAARVAGAVGLLVVPLMAIILRDPEAHFAPGGRPSVLFVHLSLVFVWAMALYAFFVAPLLDEERDRKRFEAQLAADLGPAGRRRRLVRRALVAVGIAVAIAILLGDR